MLYVLLFVASGIAGTSIAFAWWQSWRLDRRYDQLDAARSSASRQALEVLIVSTARDAALVRQATLEEALKRANQRADAADAALASAQKREIDALDNLPPGPADFAAVADLVRTPLPGARDTSTATGTRASSARPGVVPEHPGTAGADSGMATVLK